MPTFYRKKSGDKTVYKDAGYTQPIKDEAELRSLGGVPDWGPDASKTNIHSGGLKGTLVHTLPSGDDKKFLPSGKIDQFSLLRMSLKTASEMAIKRGLRSGMETVTGKLEEQAGFAPGKVAGGMMGSIIDFVEGQVAPPIEKQFETTKSIIDSIEKQQEKEIIRSRENLDNMINTGSLMYIDDNELSNISAVSGVPIEQLKAYKTSLLSNQAIDNAQRISEEEERKRDEALDLYKAGLPVSYEDLGLDEQRTEGSRSWRNRNPGNIEYGEFAKSMGAISTDGRFAIFPDEETGERAMLALLKAPNYQNKSVEDAMRRWSGKGYGEDVVPEFTGRMMNTLSEKELKSLSESIKRREGWIEGKTSTIAQEVDEDEEAPVTFQSALEDTAKYLTELRDTGKLSDMNYAQALSGFMADFGVPEEQRQEVESAINNLMSGEAPISDIQEEENLGSDFDYTPLILKSREGIVKSREDLPGDAKLVYDKLKKDNPYSSAAFLIRETLKIAGINK